MEPAGDSEEEANGYEQLRQRYRREAQLAIEDAKTRTKREVEEIYFEKIKILEDEVRRWKCVAEAVSEEPSVDLETDPKAPLLRYIMEGVRIHHLAAHHPPSPLFSQVYREIKKEFSDGTEESQLATTRTKVRGGTASRLFSSSHSLTESAHHCNREAHVEVAEPHSANGNLRCEEEDHQVEAVPLFIPTRPLSDCASQPSLSGSHPSCHSHHRPEAIKRLIWQRIHCLQHQYCGEGRPTIAEQKRFRITDGSTSDLRSVSKIF
jgi:hypothetical protein